MRAQTRHFPLRTHPPRRPLPPHTHPRISHGLAFSVTCAFACRGSPAAADSPSALPSISTLPRPHQLSFLSLPYSPRGMCSPFHDEKLRPLAASSVSLWMCLYASSAALTQSDYRQASKAGFRIHTWSPSDFSEEEDIEDGKVARGGAAAAAAASNSSSLSGTRTRIGTERLLPTSKCWKTRKAIRCADCCFQTKIGWAEFLSSAWCHKFQDNAFRLPLTFPLPPAVRMRVRARVCVCARAQGSRTGNMHHSTFNQSS